jgi:hypothetical protein
VLLPQVCAELPELCKALSEHKDIHAFLGECAEVLEPLLNSAKIAMENAEAVKECLQCMAAGSLALLIHQCRQMERPVTMEQLIRKLQNSYRPHEDRGWLRTREEDIRRDLADIERQAHSAGIRGLEDQQRLSCSYLRLALDCVKARMFMELELPSLLPVQEQNANFIMTL